MVFILSLLVFQAIVIIQCIRTAKLIHAGSLDRFEGGVTILGMMASTMLMGFPILQEIGTVAVFSQGKPISPSPDFLPLWFLGFGGALAVGVFGFRLRRQHAASNGAFFKIGANVFGIAIGAYMLFVVADQLLFFLPSRQEAGMVNWAIFRAEGTVKDMQCQSDMLVVKGLESDTLTFRCPNGGAMVMGRFSGTPIVPWPNYSEGASHQLAIELRKMLRNSVDATDGSN